MNLKNIQHRMHKEKIMGEKIFTSRTQKQKEAIVKLEQEIQILNKLIDAKNQTIEDIKKNINDINTYFKEEAERNNQKIEKMITEQKECIENINEKLEVIKQSNKTK